MAGLDLDALLRSLPPSSSQNTSPSQGVPYMDPLTPVNDAITVPSGAYDQSGSQAGLLQNLAAPPPTLNQNLSTTLPDASYGNQGGIFHALGQAFQANPNGLQKTATSDPGVIGGMLPQGSGAQNFLGRLGDAFLIANGKAPIHREFAQQQSEAAAEQPMFQAGPFDANGQITDQARQSIAALAKVNPQAALQLQSSLAQSQIARANMMRETANAQSEIANRNAESEQRSLGNARAMLSSANAANYPVVKGLVQKYLTAKGVDTSLLNLPDAYNADTIKSIQLGGVPVQRQMQMGETSEHHRELEKIGEENAASNRGKVGAMYANAGANSARAGADTQRANVDAQRLAADIQGGKTGPNTVHGSGHHVFGGAAAAVSAPPFAPGRPGRTVTNGTHTFYSPDGKTWVAR